MLACASQYRPVVTCVTLYTLKDDSAVLAPAAAAHTLSVDWQGVLPQGTPAPRTDEFVIPIQRLDAMVVSVCTVASVRRHTKERYSAS